MIKVTEEQKAKLRDLFLSPGHRTNKLIASLSGVPVPGVVYYKAKWGFSKKRRAKRNSKNTQPTVKKEGYPTIAAFKAAYDQSSVITKAILLTNVKAWVEDETKALNSLSK